MPQYMLLIRGDDTVERSPAEMQSIVQDYMAWAGKLRSEGRMLGGDELAGNDSDREPDQARAASREAPQAHKEAL